MARRKFGRKVTELKVDHPDFSRSIIGSHTDKRHVLFVFERAARKDPTPNQLAVYDKNRKIVEEHGGRMIANRWELGARNPAFSVADVESMKRLVGKTHRELLVIDHWNGAGCHALTIACLRKARK